MPTLLLEHPAIKHLQNDHRVCVQNIGEDILYMGQMPTRSNLRNYGFPLFPTSILDMTKECFQSQTWYVTTAKTIPKSGPDPDSAIFQEMSVSPILWLTRDGDNDEYKLHRQQPEWNNEESEWEESDYNFCPTRFEAMTGFTMQPHQSPLAIRLRIDTIKTETKELTT